MKRVIKFRGKRKNGPEILIGDLVHSCNGGPCIFPHDSETLSYNSPDYFEVDSKTVGQFTGLHDKNGKEIYEGDTVAEIDKLEELESWGDPLTVKFGQFPGEKDSWGLASPTTGFYLEYKDGSTTGIHSQENGYGFNAKKLMIVSHIYESKPVMK